VETIYETICRPCPKFSAVAQACNICGCGISASKSAWLNKARMATESCPLDPPRWTAAAGTVVH